MGLRNFNLWGLFGSASLKLCFFLGKNVTLEMCMSGRFDCSQVVPNNCVLLINIATHLFFPHRKQWHLGLS